MSAPMYFLPGLQSQQLCPAGDKLIRSFLQDRGLGEVFADIETSGQVATANLSHGPGGGSGCLIVALPIDPKRRFCACYDEAHQTWEKVNDRLYIGVETESPPQPEDLQRQKTHAGYEIELADGGTWIAPIIRRPQGVCERAGMKATELPRNLRWDTEGVLQESLKPSYRNYWDVAGEVADHFFDGDEISATPVEMTEDWAMRQSILFLSLNYRVWLAEQNVMGFLDSENYATVLGCAIDMPQAMLLIREWNTQKKTDGSRLVQGGMNSGNGDGAESETTKPVEATSI